VAADLVRLATDERRDLATFLGTLSSDDWAHPSLCTEWSVRDVVAHILSYEELGVAGVAMAFVRGGFKPERINIPTTCGLRKSSTRATTRTSPIAP
jgi:uncharacterized protein (TIGR03083 family)